MAKESETDMEPPAKDYTDPPPAPFFHFRDFSLWSFYRALIAEFIATLLFLYITVATVIGHKRTQANCGSVGVLGIAWAFGGMIFVLVYCTAGISGGHINPAVTFGLFLARKVSLPRAVLYMIAQCLGAICGVGLVKAFQKSYYDRYGGGANVVAYGYTKGVGLAAEIIGTFILVYTVFSATDPKRSARDSHVPVLAPLPIGFAVFIVHLGTIPITGTGINPARSFGAAVIYGHQKAWDDQWIFWVGPFIGAAIASAYHQYILRAGAMKALGSFRSVPSGTFALYSLLCRHANLNLLPNRQPLDAQLSTYKVSGPRETALSRAIKSFFEKHQIQRIGLLLVVMLGTCLVILVIGDRVLTPTISVLSAVQGIKVKADLDDRYIVLIACVILVGLFALQHFGTRKVGFLFAPIVIAWLLCISSIGIYNIIRWNPTVFRAISPYYMFNFFRKTKVDGWESLGGIVLCITGVEAMFADLGHFSQLSIKIAFTGVVYPCLILAYMGDAAFLSKHKGDLQRSFYMSIPEVVFWPVFVVATLAAVVGSQAVISTTFSIINQCSALSCFPRVKVVHTSNQIYGQNCARPAI